ncbi:hypothetical protein RXV86_00255 [Alisedimentitalea sp. MJ-SS2]|uniref:hypothetical protein n=1 Tax=Aliisedimentitalea sp. MJ-SS2 TaxID=3049795 RepID=UPI0029114F26|nr:hypothetical protein [Alisedimentitalea sp. MJ-SS2]MDU8925807.1 hypothetical protein [Alisedimentitalea sp. MJ-SS2]
MPKLKSLLTAAIAALIATAVQAAEPVKQHNSNAIWFVNWIGLTNATLTISEPSGKIVTIHAQSGTPVYKLSGDVQDGVYRYELTAATDKTRKIVNQIDSGRGENQSDSEAIPYHGQGHFTVERGVIVPEKDIKEDEG